ncbi:unnamed protein product, partial [Eretmochelys imbricata]
MEGTGVTSAAAMPTTSLNSRGRPQLAGKARARRRGRAPLKPLGPPWQGPPPLLRPRYRPRRPPLLPPPPALRISLPQPRASAAPPPATSSSLQPTASDTINSGQGPFPTMTRKHGVQCLLVPASPHIETYVQALVRVVGPSAIVAASKMYGKVVFFLAATQEAVERGLAVGGVFVPLELLEDLGIHLVLATVPPFLPNAALLPTLSTLGKPVSVINPLLLGCKDPTLRQIFSFCWHVQLLLLSA